MSSQDPFKDSWTVYFNFKYSVLVNLGDAFHLGSGLAFKRMDEARVCPINRWYLWTKSESGQAKEQHCTKWKKKLNLSSSIS